MKILRTSTVLRLIGILALGLSSNLALAQANEKDAPCFDKSSTYFRCTVGGKPVGFCTNFDTDGPSVKFLMGKSDKNGIHEFQYDVYEGAKEKFSVAQHVQGKATLTSVFFKNKDTTYAVTECQGMECNMDKSTWLTILKGKNKVKGSGYCAADTSSGFLFPFGEDKKGNLIIKMKEYFTLQKKPLEAFLTTNESWAE